LAYICWAHDPTDLFHGIEIRTQATMHGEYFFIDDCGDWQAVKTIRKRLPQLNVVPPLAFVVEAVNTIDRSTFMISAEDEEIFGVFDLVGQKQADGFQGLFASIYVIAEEEVVGFWRESSVLE